MRAVLQRVSSASVSIDNEIFSSIQGGIMLLLGIECADSKEDIDWLLKKIINLRIFNDKDGVMNRSLLDVDGELLVVSQFTLQAKTKKGNRPSYINAAGPDIAIPLYEQFIEEALKALNKTIATGKFGANMQVELVNDGPVTIILDSKQKDF